MQDLCSLCCQEDCEDRCGNCSVCGDYKSIKVFKIKVPCYIEVTIHAEDKEQAENEAHEYVNMALVGELSNVADDLFERWNENDNIDEIKFDTEPIAESRKPNGLKIATDKGTGTKFDDWAKAEEDFNACDTWTQVCDKCAKEHGLLESGLDIDAGHGICGVVGCENEAVHYYDFNRVEE